MPGQNSRRPSDAGVLTQCLTWGSMPKPPEILWSEFRACPHSVPGNTRPIAAWTGNLSRVVGAGEPKAPGFVALFLSGL